MFIQNQAIPWEDGVLRGDRSALNTRLLSQDDASRALTAIVRFDGSWRADKLTTEVDEEWLVLAGQLSVDGRACGAFAFHTLNGRGTHSVQVANEGATVLIMRSDAASDGAAHAASHADPTSEGLETWTKNPYTRYLLGTGVRPLHENKVTGEVTFLYSALPFRFMAKRWTHPVVQEMFVLAGEYAINDVGLMTPGAYAWWQPNIWHGPYGSRTGFMMLIKSHGGPLANSIDDEIVPVNYAPPYRPVLPKRLKPFAKAPVSTSVV